MNEFFAFTGKVYISNTFFNYRVTKYHGENYMHLPDGLLPLTIAIPAFAITIIAWIISFRYIKLDEKQVPMMGLLTALFFAAMMMNFPMVGPTTAHLLGAAAIGLILGPFAGLISMTIILVLQALLFGDGGLIVLGPKHRRHRSIHPMLGFSCLKQAPQTQS